jgi:hypothetical protein
VDAWQHPASGQHYSRYYLDLEALEKEKPVAVIRPTTGGFALRKLLVVPVDLLVDKIRFERYNTSYRIERNDQRQIENLSGQTNFFWAIVHFISPIFIVKKIDHACVGEAIYKHEWLIKSI